MVRTVLRKSQRVSEDTRSRVYRLPYPAVGGKVGRQPVDDCVFPLGTALFPPTMIVAEFEYVKYSLLSRNLHVSVI